MQHPAGEPAASRSVPFRFQTTLWALLVPLAITAVAIALAWSWRDELPDPVASHWGGDGPDGFAPLSQGLWILGAIVVPFSLFVWALGFFAGRAAAVRRIAAFFGVFFAVAICGVIVGSLWIQRGLADATQAGGVGGVTVAAFGGGTLLGAGAAWLTPGDEPLPTSAPVPAGAPRAPVNLAEERWRGIVLFPRPWAFAGVGVAFAAAMGLVTRSWGTVLALGLVVVLLCASLLRWTVTVDRRGLVARSLLPFPRTVVPLDEVESAEVVRISPLRDFGGWGYRVGGGGRVGIAIRAGEAILVRRTGERELVVTVDGAERAAALLNTLADRSRR